MSISGTRTTNVTTVGIRDVLSFLRRGALLALFVAAVAGGTAYVVSSQSDPVYRAAIALVASQPSGGFATLDVIAPPPVDPGVYRSALLEGNVVGDAILRLTGEVPSEQALERFTRSLRVSIENQQVSSIIRISVDHNDPVFAADVANTIAEELIIWDRERARRTLLRGVTSIERAIADIDRELAGDVVPERQQALMALRQQRVQELELASTANASAVVVGLLEPLRFATPPEQTVGPRVVFSTFIATLLGLVGGYGFLFVRSALDTRVGDRDTLTALTGLPVLAEFARRGRRQYRLSGETASFLRTNVMLATRGVSPRVLVVTSGVDTGEKDGVGVALAESFARSGSKTLLIDADLRHPGTTEWLDVVPSHAAPFEVYLANADRRYLPVSVSVGQRQTFDFVPSFTSARFPVDLLNQGLPPQLENWKSGYDVIVLDATPLAPFADTLALAPFATGVIFCMSAHRTTLEQLRESLGLLERAQVPVLGIVMTGLASKRTRRRASAEDLSVLEQQAVDPYKTAVPSTRRPVDRATG